MSLITPAQASVTDKPRFQIGGVVIVWGGDGAGKVQVSDFIFSRPAADAVDLIAGHVQPVITGTLYTHSAHPGYGELGRDSAFSPLQSVNTRTDIVQNSFYVASNTAFHIRAVLELDDHTEDIAAGLGKIVRTLTIERTGVDSGLSYGSAAQYPHSGSTSHSGVVNNGPLHNLLHGQLVFAGDRATATHAGTVADQSVRFTNTYEVIGTSGFEEGVNRILDCVIYTVAIP